ncbi:MAG TPA: vir-repressed protein [Candidatus Saccharimonadia bacterium]|nr:vir-repressed protein [Candidatus Saccharimonadia bacterium]
MFIKIALLMSGLWLVTACTVTPAYVEVSRPVVVVPAVTYESPPPAGHCPPGHAKKGWC